MRRSSSAMKLQEQVSEEPIVDDTLSGYRMFDVDQLTNFIRQFPCPTCQYQCYDVTEVKAGLATSMKFTCRACSDELNLHNTSGENINVRFQMAIYSIGGHYTHGQRFLANMNMPPPVSTSQSNHYKDTIHAATEKVAQQSMAKSARELSDTLPPDCNATVSCDGTWQRRGFSSKNGVATVLSVNPNGPAKVIDVDISSNHCDACAKARKKYDADQFAAWYTKHEPACAKNHEGSAGQMEPRGMLRVFRRSEEKHNLKYSGYLGDGDSKSFSAVANVDPPVYTDVEIVKLECCGHVQKRMGKRLLDKVVELKSKRFKEGRKSYKGIGGAGGLTKKAIKVIQGHYGGAIRGNVGDLGKMKTAVMAIWKHRGKDHSDCGDWCPAHSGDLGKANKNCLPKFVLDAIKPVFEVLSADGLLAKCTHGGTQNSNESFHHLIWSRCPKTVFVGRKRLETAVFDAAVVYNDGEMGRMEIFSNLGLAKGDYMKVAFHAFNRKAGDRGC